MKELHRKYPTDWKAARAEMARKYYVEEPADSKTIWNANLNGAAGILALLYGGGDFQKTLDLACVMGFDADNQAATMSGLIWLIVRRKGIPESLLFPFPELGWKEPLNDLYKNVTRHDMPDASLKDMAMRWLTVPRSLYTANVEVIRDGKRFGDNSTFYSIGAEPGDDAMDFYGYEWTSPQKIGLLAYNMGLIEESGGWFNSLNVEYRGSSGDWIPVTGLKITPEFPPGKEPFNKPHFVEYLLSFAPVETTAIRMTGEAGGAPYRRSGMIRFTSITELGVYGPIERNN